MILVVTAGTYLFGIAGALFAVPVTAMANTVVRYLADRDASPGGGPGLVPERDEVSGPDDADSHDSDEHPTPSGDAAV